MTGIFSMVWINIFVGIALLLLGRRLYWLFIGGVGFIAGLAIASIYFKSNPSGEVEIVVALAAGIVGVLMAIFIQRSAVWLVGFLAGGFVALSLTRLLSVDIWFMLMITFIMGGFLGALLTSVIFEWGLIILSSAIGSILIAQSVVIQNQLLSWILLVGSFMFGIIVQSIKKKKKVKKVEQVPERRAP